MGARENQKPCSPAFATIRFILVGLVKIRKITYSYEAIAKLPFFVTPAKAGVFNLLNDRDSCFRRNDKKLEKGNFAIASYKLYKWWWTQFIANQSLYVNFVNLQGINREFYRF